MTRSATFVDMMMLTKRRPVADPVEFKIEPLVDDPEYKLATAQLARLESRLREATEREARARLRARGGKPALSEVERGNALAAGGFIPGVDPSTEIAAAHEEIEPLQAEPVERRPSELDFAGTLSQRRAQARWHYERSPEARAARLRLVRAYRLRGRI
jgi:hypothetical protein